MSSRIFQSVIMQMKDASERSIGVVDEQGNVLASSDLALMGARLEIRFAEQEPWDGVFQADGKTCRCIAEGGRRGEYCVFVEGTDALASGLCIVAAVALAETKASYDDKHDTATFVKNIISDNILPGDVYVRAKELRFNTEAPRAVFIIRQLSGSDHSLMEYLQQNFAAAERDYLLSTSESDITFIKELNAPMESEDIEKIALNIQETIQNELDLRTVIGVGSPVMHLRELADRYKEAQTAIEVGKVFDTEKSVISYGNLGIGRIIYQLPNTLCEMFLSEVFKKSPIDSLDQETLYTINKFFENNLNVSETSRKLFVHRNTLVYRLEKIKKLTGLDLREFDHAIVFKVALMVKKYLDSQNGRNIRK